ncbi:MAG: glycyl-radical enzyme activating protein [Porphyromonadaceae bacterium]|nr:MAG: glycyl-radical enzyme activating protein [Porphyromonadaceae bacterium]
MQQGRLFDIQHFGVHDGPGIRTLVFFKGCPLRCLWCCNPESHSPDEQIRYVDFKCKACFQCVNVCPYQGITPLDESVKIDFVQCTTCLKKSCLDACNHGTLNLTGYTISAEKLIKIIGKDSAFYRNSGGGVTFTGGEPLSQPEFLGKILRKCKKAGIHTAIETCGYCSQAVLKEIIPLVDLFLFDIKIIDPEKHRKYTGKSNQLILENLTYLSTQKKRIIIRFPLIPGITDTDQNINDVILLLKKLGLVEIDLEPYHGLGIAKYEELGMEYLLHGIAGDSGYPIDRLRQIEDFFIPF